MLHRYKPRLHYYSVNPTFVDTSWVKCNKDGVSRGNPGESSYDFYIKDYGGNVIYAMANTLGIIYQYERKNNVNVIGFEIV